MNNNHKGSTQVVVIVVLVLVVLVGAYFFFTNNQSANAPTSYAPPQNQNPPAGTTANAAPVIQNDQALMSASQNLDAVGVNQLDSGLNQNSADAQSFAPRIRYKNGQSTNWSGYAVETNLANPQSNVASDVKGSWVVPSVTCTGTNTYSSAWVGIDGYSDNSVEQIGTEQDCRNGSPTYYAWYEMYPKPGFRINLPVAAGDAISAEVQYIGGNKFRLTLSDMTTGKTFITTQNAKASRQSAEWIMEAPWSGGVLPLANFGTIAFSNAKATLNDQPGTINNNSWQNDQIVMVNSSGNAKATPSSLSADGSSFSVTWNSSN